MKSPPAVLVVDDSEARHAIVETLRGAGYAVTSAATFEQATEIVSSAPPDLLITELRLGAFNGLHLILRARAANSDLVAIIHTAFPDPVLEADARRMQTEFLVRPVAAETLLEVVAQYAGREAERRREPRKSVPEGLAVTVSGRPATLVDISYAGFRVEVPGGTVPDPLEMALTMQGISVTGDPVWTRRREALPERMLCGAIVTGLDATTASAWRRVVDGA